ncbi:uncharacterized protein BJX67DRAFT_382333 [Aspergillus lucknowensis]|uniref:AA1-like domain-containing protein n=1 Tax=Aspergillus lucknowensis TaxID=176173 RepID=A0ABR4LPA4_9EURO
MKFSIASLFTASSALALPSTLVARDGFLFLTNYNVRISGLYRTSEISFTLYDPISYPDDTPTNCTLLWGPIEPPNEDACENGQYAVRYQGSNLRSYTLEFERVSGSIPEKGSVSFSGEDENYTCSDDTTNPVSTCSYDGPIVVEV